MINFRIFFNSATNNLTWLTLQKKWIQAYIADLFVHFRGLRLAEVLKCPHERKNIRATIECLRSKNATDLVNSEWQGIAFGIAEFPFVPVIDGAFLDETPQKSMDTKNFKKTNIMMGANKDEGVFFILYYLTDLFKNEETVFVNREDFIKSVGELNIYVKSVGREVCDFWCF